jgi:hypothetical protein
MTRREQQDLPLKGRRLGLGDNIIDELIRSILRATVSWKAQAYFANETWLDER